MLSQAARHLFYAVTGEGGGFIREKAAFHARRSRVERALIAEGGFEARECPVCGRSGRPLAHANALGVTFSRCADEGTLFVDPAPREDQLKRLFSDPVFAHAPVQDPQRDLDEVRAAAGTGRRLRLLDAGCGTGGFLKRAAEYFDVRGVEVSAVAAAEARAKGLEIAVGRLEDLPGDALFDVVTMISMLEHLLVPRDALAAARRLVAPGGVIYVGTPNIGSKSFEVLQERHTHLSSLTNLNLFTQAGLFSLASATGLELVSHSLAGGIDLSVADYLTRRLPADGFVHRLALYKPRLYHGLKALEEVGARRLLPKGDATFQHAVFRRPADS